MFEITYWKTEASDALGLLSVPGLMIRGWWPSNPPPPVDSAAGIHGIWWGIARSVELGPGFVEEPDQQVVAFVRLGDHVDSAPLEPLEASLRLLVDQGAAIAWAGGHECDRSFHATSGGERCFAAFTAGTGFVCAAVSGREYLDAAEIAWLRSAVRNSL